MTRLTLHCFPYAGGNSWSYRPLASHCLPDLAVAGIELPGRGRRSREPFCATLEAMADDCFAQLRPDIGKYRYAFFGHSMGALLAYLCALRIQRADLPLPEALILSGQAAPNTRIKTARHRLPSTEFIAMLHDLGGCPPEILQEKELIEYFEPILRADFQAVETWESHCEEALPVPILALQGNQDESTLERTESWSQATCGKFSSCTFDGDHFFIQKHWPEIASTIKLHLGLQPAA